MKKTLLYLACACVLVSVASCGGKNAEENSGKDAAQPAVEQYKDIYTGDYDRQQTFIVISKKDLKLTVYAPVNGDTLPVAQFPVCLSRNKGQKQGSEPQQGSEARVGRHAHSRE